MSQNFKRFDIIITDLDPPKGHAQGGIRPSVVVQSNLFNSRANTLVVVPLTSVTNNVYPGQFLVQASSKNGLECTSRFLANQIMTLDKRYISKKIGRLEEKYHLSVQEALSVVLDFEGEF